MIRKARRASPAAKRNIDPTVQKNGSKNGLQTSGQNNRELAASVEEIRFYRANEKPYGVLSNLYRREIEFEGQHFPTAEHAYQAGKARKAEVREWILSAPSPSLVAMAAHGLYNWDVAPNWSTVKYGRMRRVLLAKFTQHEDLREILLATGEARLVEAASVANTVNRTWGEVNGKGQNLLGLMLMEVRAVLRSSIPLKPGVSRFGRMSRPPGASKRPRK